MLLDTSQGSVIYSYDVDLGGRDVDLGGSGVDLGGGGVDLGSVDLGGGSGAAPDSQTVRTINGIVNLVLFIS